MNRNRRFRLYLTLVFILAGAIGGFFRGIAAGPVYEARATVCIRSAEALTALPGILEAEYPPLSAYAIPGTHLLEAAVRADTPESAAGELDAALESIPTALSYLGISPGTETLRTGTQLLSQPRPVTSALVGGLLGLGLALILFAPPAPERPPLSLTGVLRRTAGLAKRYRLVLMILVPVCALFGFLGTVPAVARSEALVRVGEFQPDSVPGIGITFPGLMASNLAEEGISVSPLGSSNLFRLRAEGATPAQAQQALQTAIARWPELELYALMPLPMTVLEPPSLPEAPSSQANVLSSLALGGGAGAVLFFSILFLCATGKEKSFTGRYAND